MSGCLKDYGKKVKVDRDDEQMVKMICELEDNSPRYILDLILFVISVNVEMNEIVNNLPKLEYK